MVYKPVKNLKFLHKAMVKIISFFSVCCILLTSCESNENYLMSSSGLAGEVILVMENEYWNGPLGDTTKAYLETPQKALPQPEYIFNLGQYNHRGFSNIIRNHRNIILFEIDKQFQTPKIEFLQNVYATNQVVIKLMASSPETCSNLFIQESSKIINLINRRERERLIDKHLARPEASIMDTLKNKYKLNLTIPEDCMLAVSKPDFVWIKRDRVRYVSGEAHDVDQGIFIYTYPYTDDSTFTLSYLLSKRDSLLKYNVPGPSEGSYMATEHDSAYFPIMKQFELNENYTVEIRGLYKTINDYYGGPFISLVTYDKARNRIVTIDSYVFAPKFHKREYLREMEAICYSLTFP